MGDSETESSFLIGETSPITRIMALRWALECNRLLATVENFSCKQVRHSWKIATLLLQLRVLRFGFSQDGGGLTRS